VEKQLIAEIGRVYIGTSLSIAKVWQEELPPAVMLAEGRQVGARRVRPGGDSYGDVAKLS